MKNYIVRPLQEPVIFSLFSSLYYLKREKNARQIELLNGRQYYSWHKCLELFSSPILLSWSGTAWTLYLGAPCLKQSLFHTPPPPLSILKRKHANKPTKDKKYHDIPTTVGSKSFFFLVLKIQRISWILNL